MNRFTRMAMFRGTVAGEGKQVAFSKQRRTVHFGVDNLAMRVCMRRPAAGTTLEFRDPGPGKI
jgi:hypothetical protein